MPKGWRGSVRSGRYGQLAVLRNAPKKVLRRVRLAAGVKQTGLRKWLLLKHLRRRLLIQRRARDSNSRFLVGACESRIYGRKLRRSNGLLRGQLRPSVVTYSQD